MGCLRLRSKRRVGPSDLDFVMPKVKEVRVVMSRGGRGGERSCNFHENEILVAYIYLIYKCFFGNKLPTTQLCGDSDQAKCEVGVMWEGGYRTQLSAGHRLHKDAPEHSLCILPSTFPACHMVSWNTFLLYGCNKSDTSWGSVFDRYALGGPNTEPQEVALDVEKR